MITLTMEELQEAMSDILGDNFRIEEDVSGQVIIHTGLQVNDDEELIPFVSDEGDDDSELGPVVAGLDDLDEE